MSNKSSLLNNYDLVNCLRGLGSAWRGLKNHDASLVYHLQELTFVKNFKNRLAVGKAYYIIAQTYLCMKNYKMALKYSRKARKLLLSNNHKDECVYVYHIMAMVYREEKRFDLASMYQKKTLDIQKRLLTKNHPELGITYQNLAILFDSTKDYQQAKFYYDKALYIFENHVHPIIQILKPSKINCSY